MNIRIGQGFDAHRFAPDRRLVLGGVDIPWPLGMAAHSDGDVVIHALCDALLGAACLGDIGKHFPDTDARWKGVDSRVLLREVRERVAARGWRIVNVDITVIAQRPKLSPHFPAMQAHLAADLGLPEDCVNLKGTTTEQMGFTGREEGIAASAVALLAG